MTYGHLSLQSGKTKKPAEAGFLHKVLSLELDGEARVYLTTSWVMHFTVKATVSE